MGYTANEIDDIQAGWRLRFPPDLVVLLRERRRPLEGPGAFDWIKGDPDMIRARLDWPIETFWFDVEHNGVWWPDWGEKPAAVADQRAVFEAALARAPRLIPLFGHRYIAEEPFESGNPVFSVHQSDIICYGANLADWLMRERDGYDAAPWPPIKTIRFWSDALQRNNAAP
jgi:hypothetical protein